MKKKLPLHLRRVLTVLQLRRWLSPMEISELSDTSPLAVTARVRDLRKWEYGSHTIEKTRDDNGIWFYRLAR